MTLKEKFKPFVFYVTASFNVARENDKEKNAQQCEKIADDYAIEFVEWITNEKSKYAIMYGNQQKRFATVRKDYTTKELLEIFKKQKGW